jgi:hypothetical protein
MSQSKSDPPNDDLAKVMSLVSQIDPLVQQAKACVDAWIEAKDKNECREWDVISVHIERLSNRVAVLKDRIVDLRSPFNPRLFKRDWSEAFLGKGKIIETGDAYDEERLNRLCARDVRDASEFGSEMRDMFGFASMDEELDTPLTAALECLLIELEDARATVPGSLVKAMKVLFKGHPRCFGRYYTGTDTWPRPSAVVQAEIDIRMPEALRWLRYELSEAIEWEATMQKPKDGGSDER